MHQLLIQICKNREEAETRKETIMSSTDNVNWKTHIIENIGFVKASLVPDLKRIPTVLPIIFSPETDSPKEPAVVLLIWTED